MSDPYAWIDPFAEKDRADNLQSRAWGEHARGRHQALRELGDEGIERFPALVKEAVAYLAANAARDRVLPWAEAHLDEMLQLEKREKEQFDVLMRAAGPVARAIVRNGEVTLESRTLLAQGVDVVDVRFTVEAPYKIECRIDPIPGHP